MRKFENAVRKGKTSKANRTNYCYYTAEGKKITLTPETVGEEWVAYLHEEDDQMVNAERRNEYRVQLRFSGQEDWLQRNRNSPVSSDTKDNPRFSDLAVAEKSYMDNPLTQIIKAVDAVTNADKVKQVQAAIKTLQPQQQELIRKVFYQNRTRVDIAAEEGVSEAAVRNRLKKIYATLAKKIKP